MKMLKLGIAIVVLALTGSAMATERSSQTLVDMSKRFFPAIGVNVGTCAKQWPRYFRDGDRELIVEGYFDTATKVLSSDDYALDLRKQFAAMARYWKTDAAALLKVFGCARYITSEVKDGQNLFAEANRAFLAFDDELKNAFFANIDAFREDFGGRGVKDKATKIKNIAIHIGDLETLKTNSSPEFESELHAQDSSIYNFILSQSGEKRELALAFSIATAKSSLEIVRYFEPPTKKELAGIVVNEIGHNIACVFGSLFGECKK